MSSNVGLRTVSHKPEIGPADQATLLRQFQSIRQATDRLTDSLSGEDCTAQSMPDCSPTKWHLAHTSWFFETFILSAQMPAYQPFHPAFRALFNSYYQTVGQPYARPNRSLITRPGLDEVRAYRQHVTQKMEQYLSASRLNSDVLAVIELGLHHEQQHQELILTDLKHLLSFNPLQPIYKASPGAHTTTSSALHWHLYQEGVAWIGHTGAGFSFDNETPSHRVFLASFQLASRPTTNREYLEFMADEGYQRPELWLSDGWSTVQEQGWQAPLYWERQAEERQVFTLSGLRPLDLNEPVCHVSFYEADAFARWAKARLPTEAEWEHVAATTPIRGNLVESALLHPISAAGSEAFPEQLFGDVWEWTQSPYTPYPGYQPQAGALGEYNGKFMCNQIILRGGSCVTPQSHLRASYRNFFPPQARWQFSGIRLARDLS